ncbi:MAG: hypothetical protein MZW92_75235 [Comamonadaceae bacterium]|nr:hypothetical protein [Comamonadaceae bacterium]
MLNEPLTVCPGERLFMAARHPSGPLAPQKGARVPEAVGTAASDVRGARSSAQDGSSTAASA